VKVVGKQVKLDIFMEKDKRKENQSELEVQGFYDLPEGWKWVKLKEILREDRQSINPQEYPDKEFFLVTMDCIESNSGKLLKLVKCLGKEIKSTKYRFNTNHILYGKLRPYLNKVYVPESEGICTTEFIPFVVVKAVREYIAYYLRKREVVNFAMSHIIGTRQPRVIINKFLECPVPLPPLEEQKRIVSRLEQLVSRAEEAKRLRKLAREEAEKIMQVALNKVFLRVRENWGWTILDRVAEIGGGFGFPRKFQGKKGLKYLFVKVNDMNLPGNEVYITTTENTVDDELLNEMNAKTYPVGTVIFPKIGGAIATNKKRILAREGAFDNNIMGVVPKQGLLPEWLYYFFCTIDLMELAKTTALPSIRKSQVAKLKIPLPPLEEQKKIVAYLNKVKETIKSIMALQQKTEEELEKLVPSILDKAFKGEL